MTKPRIIAITGYSRVGKDTAADGLVSLGFQKLCFATALKEAIYEYNPILFTDLDGEVYLQEVIDRLGWEDAKDRYPEVREHLQDFVMAMRHHVDPDIWVKAVALQVTGDTVIPDCRFPNEVEWVRSMGGVIVRITRPGVGPVNDHISEQPIDHDIEVINQGSPSDLHNGLNFSLAAFIARRNQEALRG